MSLSDTTRSRIEHTGTHTRASTVTSVTRTRTGAVSGGAYWWRRSARAIARVSGGTVTWLRETVTGAGRLVAVLLVAGTAAGLLFGWSIAWVLAGASAVLIVLCVPFLLGGHDYRVALRLERERVVAGATVGGSLEVRNAATRLSLPGTVDVPIGAGLVEVRVPLLAASAVHREELTIAARRRGVIQVGPLSISRGDPIGILRREVVWNEIQTLYVHPVTALIPSTSSGLVRDLEGMPTNDIVDADLAFHAIREYLPGDSQRHVHWKSTAKTGTLMVRQYEETRHSRIAVLIGIVAEDEYASGDEFELAVSVAASLGLQAVRDGRDLAVATSAENPEVARGEVVSVRRIATRTPQAMLDGFSEIEAGSRASRLEDVARLVAQADPGLSIVFLVTGGVLPLERLRVAAHAFGEETQVVAVRCEQFAEPSRRRSGSLNVLTVGRLDDLGQLIARGALT